MDEAASTRVLTLIATQGLARELFIVFDAAGLVLIAGGQSNAFRSGAPFKMVPAGEETLLTGLLKDLTPLVRGAIDDAIQEGTEGRIVQIPLAAFEGGSAGSDYLDALFAEDPLFAQVIGKCFGLAKPGKRAARKVVKKKRPAKKKKIT